LKRGGEEKGEKVIRTREKRGLPFWYQSGGPMVGEGEGGASPRKKEGLTSGQGAVRGKKKETGGFCLDGKGRERPSLKKETSKLKKGAPREILLSLPPKKGRGGSWVGEGGK